MKDTRIVNAGYGSTFNVPVQRRDGSMGNFEIALKNQSDVDVGFACDVRRATCVEDMVSPGSNRIADLEKILADVAAGDNRIADLEKTAEDVHVMNASI